ncbi:MAG: PKD domain-containing protein, partial [Pirellulaceae bacterium]|nr:PKD domain-containing protein [Pirellulaceae bacterium]
MNLEPSIALAISMVVAACAGPIPAHGTDRSQPRSDPSPIQLIFHTSRKMGEAPLAVFFDATQTKGLTEGDFVNSSFFWNFGDQDTDPVGNDEADTGFLAAHVFRKPGIYRVTCHVWDKRGRRGQAKGRVEVSAFNGETYFVATRGSDANPGTIQRPLRTVKYALEHKARPHTRILFRRGDTFDFGRVNCRNKDGPVIVGSYRERRHADLPPPILRAHAASGAAFALGGARDWRIRDLHVVNADLKQSTAFGGGDGAWHLQFEDLQVEGFNMGFYLGRPPATTDGFLIFGCNINDVATYGVFGMANRFAFVDSAIKDQGANGHGIRVASGQKTIIHNSHFTSRHKAFTSVTLRGKGNGTTNSQAVITGNSFDRTAQSGPQNTGYSENVSDVLWEKNRFIDGSPVHGSIGLLITASRVTVRENLFFNVNTAV